jgi:hypothetical protein
MVLTLNATPEGEVHLPESARNLPWAAWELTLPAGTPQLSPQALENLRTVQGPRIWVQADGFTPEGLQALAAAQLGISIRQRVEYDAFTLDFDRFETLIETLGAENYGW